MQFPYGTLPGEVDGTHVHIPKGKWWLLRHDPKFVGFWKSRATSSRYFIAVSCLTRGLTEDEAVTVAYIWSQKHGHAFDESVFRGGDLLRAALYAGPFIMKFEAQAYWDELRRIARDPKARQHMKLRVSYFLMNTDSATAREIHGSIGIPLKTVRNCLGVLQSDGKVESTEYGIYRAVECFCWDRTNVDFTPEGERFTWDDHSAMCVRGIPRNESECGPDGIVRMECYDYCQGKFRTVFFDADQSFRSDILYGPDPADCEWVINENGEVVENGTGRRFTDLFTEFEPWQVLGHANGNRLDFRGQNVKVIASKWHPVQPSPQDDDFFARLFETGCGSEVAHETQYI